MSKRLLVFACAITFFCLHAHSQEESSAFDKIANFPSRLFTHIDKKTRQLDNELDRQTEKYIARVAQKEQRLKKRLYKTDSAKARTLFAVSPEQEYQSFLQKIKNEGGSEVHSMGPEYQAYTDSLKVSLAFLSANSAAIGNSKIRSDDIEKTLSQVKQLQAKLLDADAIKSYVQQRKQEMLEAFSGGTNMPSGVGGILNSYDRELYYYSQRIRSYREALNDPDKMLKKALELLSRLPAFADFMKRNSFLSGLFSIPDNYGSPDAINGMQTRDQVSAMIQSQVGQGGTNAASALQNSLQSASQDIHNIQNKISNLGAGNGDMDMPRFKPNQQKTKTFLRRLEFSTNIQTLHASWYFPATTDFGLSVGYQINNKSTVGIGASYKIGWGSGIQHISISSQGASLRSFVDVQAKKSFYVSGGFEYNYQPVPGQHFSKIDSWQQSALIGLSKIISMHTKVFKKTKVQFLWDFLSYEQVPRAQPFKFRVGYSF